MPMRRAALGLVVLASALGAAPNAAARTSCTTGDRFLQALTADGVSCPGARRITFGWARSTGCFSGDGATLADRARACTVRGFRCRPRAASVGVRVTCTSSGRAVRFLATGG